MSNKSITDREILEYICFKYSLNITQETKEAIVDYCTHKFIKNNNTFKCVNCDYITECIACINRFSKNIESYKTKIFICGNCHLDIELFICDKCNNPKLDCQCKLKV